MSPDPGRYAPAYGGYYAYGFLPLDFLVFARFFVSGSAEGFGSAKQLHIRHNIFMSI